MHACLACLYYLCPRFTGRFTQRHSGPPTCSDSFCACIILSDPSPPPLPFAASACWFNISYGPLWFPGFRSPDPDRGDPERGSGDRKPGKHNHNVKKKQAVTTLRCESLCCAVLCCAVLCGTVLCCAVRCGCAGACVGTGMRIHVGG